MSIKKLLWYLPNRDDTVMRMFSSAMHRVTYDPAQPYEGVIFTGGADVSPFLYGEKALATTSTNPGRDLRENKLFRSLPKEMPKVGICRGAQFLNVMCGGTLFQDVDRHIGVHEIIDLCTGELVPVSSTHHQMMHSHPKDGWLIGCASRATLKCTDSTTYKFDRSGDPVWNDEEVVWYEQQNALCFQPHPEYTEYTECRRYFFRCVDEYCLSSTKPVSPQIG